VRSNQTKDEINLIEGMGMHNIELEHKGYHLVDTVTYLLRVGGACDVVSARVIA